MCDGVPISAGTSKDSMPTMNESSTAASRLGATSGSVMRAQDPDLRRAADRGRLLERRVGQAERRGDEQEDRREEDRRLDEDHPVHRVDVELRRALAEDVDEDRVDEARIRPDQQDPAHRLDDVGTPNATITVK